MSRQKKKRMRRRKRKKNRRKRKKGRMEVEEVIEMMAELKTGVVVCV